MTSFLLVIIAVLLAYIIWALLIPFNRLQNFRPEPQDEPRSVVGGFARPELLKTMESRLREDSLRLYSLESQLQSQKLLNTTILDALDASLALVEPNLEIIFANGVFRTNFSPREDPVGRSLLEVCVHHEIADLATRALEARHGHTMQVDLEIYEDGLLITKNFRVRVQLAEIVSPAEQPKLLFLLEDVTRLKELETIRRDFVANASHELRTPLSIISGYIENLIDGALDDRELALRFLTTMQKHSHRLTSIVKDLLTVSRLENYAYSLDHEEIDLEECLQTVREQLGPLVRSSGAQIQVHCEPSPFVIRGDRYCFDQIFFNLIENSIKHNGSRQLTIQINAEFSGDDVVITYRDNGTGIPMQDQPFVFNRFYRVTRGGRGQTEGTGLGLAIVKKAVQAHDGEITLNSQAGVGLTITLRMPNRQEAHLAALQS